MCRPSALLAGVVDDDPARCRAAGVPEDRLTARTKLEIALEELDRLVAAGVNFGCVLADAGYGVSVSFRQALSARGLTWAVGIPRSVRVFPADVTTAIPRPRAGRHHGRPRHRPLPSAPSQSAAEMLAAARWRRLTWRTGTKGPLSARFAAVRVVVADGTQNSGGQHLPREAARCGATMTAAHRSRSGSEAERSIESISASTSCCTFHSRASLVAGWHSERLTYKRTSGRFPHGEPWSTPRAACRGSA